MTQIRFRTGDFVSPWIAFDGDYEVEYRMEPVDPVFAWVRYLGDGWNTAVYRHKVRGPGAVDLSVGDVINAGYKSAPAVVVALGLALPDPSAFPPNGKWKIGETETVLS